MHYLTKAGVELINEIAKPKAKRPKTTRGTQLRSLTVPTIPDKWSTDKYKEKPSTKRYKRLATAHTEIGRTRGHPDASKAADLLRTSRGR